MTDKEARLVWPLHLIHVGSRLEITELHRESGRLIEDSYFNGTLIRLEPLEVDGESERLSVQCGRSEHQCDCKVKNATPTSHRDE